MMIFRSFGGLSHLENYVLPLTTVSFGNMGFAGTSCAKMPIDWAHETSVTLHIHCQETTTISGVLSSGIMLDEAFPGGNADAVHNCYINPENKIQMDSFEMVQYRRKNVESIFMAKCAG